MRKIIRTIAKSGNSCGNSKKGCTSTWKKGDEIDVANDPMWLLCTACGDRFVAAGDGYRGEVSQEKTTATEAAVAENVAQQKHRGNPKTIAQQIPDEDSPFVLAEELDQAIHHYLMEWWRDTFHTMRANITKEITSTIRETNQVETQELEQLKKENAELKSTVKSLESRMGALGIIVTELKASITVEDGIIIINDTGAERNDN